MQHLPPRVQRENTARWLPCRTPGSECTMNFITHNSKQHPRARSSGPRTVQPLRALSQSGKDKREGRESFSAAWVLNREEDLHGYVGRGRACHAKGETVSGLKTVSPVQTEDGGGPA